MAAMVLPIRTHSGRRFILIVVVLCMFMLSMSVHFHFIGSSYRSITSGKRRRHTAQSPLSQRAMTAAIHAESRSVDSNSNAEKELILDDDDDDERIQELDDDPEEDADDEGSLLTSLLTIASKSRPSFAFGSSPNNEEKRNEEKAKDLEDTISVLSDSFAFPFDTAIETLSEKGLISKRTAEESILIHRKRISMISSQEGVEMSEDAVGAESVRENWKHEALVAPIKIKDVDNGEIPSSTNEDENEQSEIENDHVVLEEDSSMQGISTLLHANYAPSVKKTYPSWYTPGTKYFIYQTSGGISNQRKILEWALVVSRLLNRTCIIPPAAPHTTMYYNYEKVHPKDLVKMSDLLEVNQLKKIVPVLVVEGGSFKNFAGSAMNHTGLVWNVLDRSSLQEKRDNPWSAETLLSLFGTDSSDVLFFSKGTMWQCFSFTNAEMKPIVENVRFHPALRTTARILADSLGVFNALHIRFADGDSSHMRDGWLKPPHVFLARMRNSKFSSVTKNLYIATVPSKRESAYFNRFKSLFNVSFSDDLPQAPINRIIKFFPEKMHGTVLGIVEQLLCTRSVLFLGTGYSTFSEHIRTMRANRMLASDPVALKSENPKVVNNENKFLAQVTPCMMSTKVC